MNFHLVITKKQSENNDEIFPLNFNHFEPQKDTVKTGGGNQ